MRILVAYDGGAASTAALRWAASRAALESAELRLLYVEEGSTLPTWSSRLNSAAADPSSVLDGAEAWLMNHTRLRNFAREVRVGDPAEQIVRASLDADLVVIGSNRGDPAREAAFEALPRKVAALSARTTVVVPSTWNERSGPVVVGVGAEEISGDPVAFAAKSASLVGATLEIVHGWQALPVASHVPAGMGSAAERVSSAERDHAQEVADRVQVACPALSIRTFSEAKRALALVTTHAQSASLTVVGRRRTGLLADWLLGSVTHDLLLSLPSPVAVVPTLGSQPA